ncbi:hypothetical protein OS190_15265 [Sulfitobacter sp. F26204]|uniref:hypothetical protein n=1 Tax=Sulfitobacter sp. F26204 TaxID=2996014 RepID=UPI00225E55D7|nr:hypothetical protein [Sulfitobacter sp. F26204]MCX7560929.1 hypothetical protein [Sulfitobacter sp. F26204]
MSKAELRVKVYQNVYQNVYQDVYHALLIALLAVEIGNKAVKLWADDENHCCV